MAREMTQRMHTIMEMRRARMSYRAIAKELRISDASVRECHARALKYAGESGFSRLPAEVRQGMTADEMVRLDELEFADARLQDYLNVFRECMAKESYFNAIQALNGSHKYYETIVKIQGVSAPERHEVTFRREDLESKLIEYEAEVGTITEAEVIDFDARRRSG